jgi:hypothetical protein
LIPGPISLIIIEAHDERGQALKKASILLAAIAIFLIGGASLFADESDYYYINLRVSKVFNYSLGYRVMYQTGYDAPKDVYIPFDWFRPGGKALLVSGNDGSYPYIAVYYKKGIFDHVALYVKSNISDQSWETIPATIDLKDKFADIQELKFEF